MTAPLFAYGTLMVEEILASASGQRLKGMSATLKGFRRYRVFAEVYPGIIPDPRGSVAGILYQGISAEAWERLDRFEGEMYQRERVELVQESGDTIVAETYVIRPQFRSRLSDEAWSLEQFLSCDQGTFQQEYQGFDALDRG